MIYNTIHHEIRNAAGLSILDYCLLESIYHLSTSPNARVKGWCNAPKDYFSYLTGSRNLVKRLNVLKADGWIEFDNDKKRMLKRTTQKYYNDIYAYVAGEKKLGVNKVHTKGEQSAPSRVNKVHSKREQSAPYINKDNNTYNNINKKGVPPSADDVFNDKLSKIELPKKLEKFRAEISACIEAGYLNYNKYSDFKMQKLIKAAYDILEQHGASKLKACLKISTDNGWQSISIDYIKKSRGKKTDGLNSLPVEQRQNGVAEAWKAAAEQDDSLTIFTF